MTINPNCPECHGSVTYRRMGDYCPTVCQSGCYTAKPAAESLPLLSLTVIDAVQGTTDSGEKWWVLEVKHTCQPGNSGVDLFVDPDTYAACPVGTRFRLVRE